jgi:hypothetical protein
MIRLARPLAVLALALLVQTFSSRAQPVSDEPQLATASGFSAFDTTETEVESLADSRRLMHVRSAGTFYTEDPGSPFNETSYDCFGTHLLRPDGSSVQGHGYCAGVATTGDLWWIDWTGDLDQGHWRFSGGTGTFEGIEGGGSWRNQAALAGEETVTTWHGAWHLPD